MTGKPAPGLYDNRWITLPQDFPSATFLQARGIRRVVLVQGSARDAKEDLSHVLLRWQEGGIELSWHTLEGGRAGDLTVPPPSFFRKAWYRLVATASLKRSNVGGFGAALPEASAGAGTFVGGYG
jgi:hypothetical protein